MSEIWSDKVDGNRAVNLKNLIANDVKSFQALLENHKQLTWFQTSKFFHRTIYMKL
jgi:hypothetical protein